MDDTRFKHELDEIDGVRARLTDVVDEGHLPFPESHYVTNALDALYACRLWLLKSYTPTNDGDAA